MWRKFGGLSTPSRRMKIWMEVECAQWNIYRNICPIYGFQRLPLLLVSAVKCMWPEVQKAKSGRADNPVYQRSNLGPGERKAFACPVHGITVAPLQTRFGEGGGVGGWARLLSNAPCHSQTHQSTRLFRWLTGLPGRVCTGSLRCVHCGYPGLLSQYGWNYFICFLSFQEAHRPVTAFRYGGSGPSSTLISLEKNETDQIKY